MNIKDTNLLIEAEKSAEALEEGISYSGRRGCYEVDRIKTEETMKKAADIIRRLINEENASELNK